MNSESRAVSLQQFAEISTRIEQEAAKVIMGQETLVRQLWVAMLAGGNVLLEGVPGLGKTLLIRTFSKLLGCSFNRIQFTPDLMPPDILGAMILYQSEDGGRELRFERGPVFANLVLADEINRAAPRTQAALLEAMEEGQVSVGGELHLLPRPFFLLATQNPIEMEGTYPLPEAQLDRFLFKITVPYPDEDTLVRIAKNTQYGTTPSVSEVASASMILSMQSIGRQVPVAENVYRYVARLVQASRPENSESPPAIRQHVRLGASPRGVQAILAAARVEALLSGRRAVAITDVVNVAVPALAHRLILHYGSVGSGVVADDLVGELLRAVAVPQ